MYMIDFINEQNKKFLLHDGKSFVGGTKEQCEKICEERIISAITADFEVIEVKDYDVLAEMIGFVPGHPYKILDFNNGLTRWMGVEIIK